MTQTIDRPDQLSAWLSCPRCRTLLYGRRFRRNLAVCPECGFHSSLDAPQRLDLLLDEGSQRRFGPRATAYDPLGFTDTRPYPERIADARTATGLDEAVICARGTVHGHPVVVAAMDFRFMGGSLGSAAGELITVAAETALAERTPLLMVTASGGARMQEGALSLLQMAKTSQALAELDEAGVLTVSLITDPTYGGVAASFASVPDIMLAEPNARMGFAGPRVIAQTIRQDLPQGFQTAEFLSSHGLVDAVVARADLRDVLGRLLAVAHAGRPVPPGDPGALITEPTALPDGDAWDTVRLARHPQRPTTLDYINYLTEGFVELHGDRLSADCPAVVGGTARLDGRPVMILGNQKGHRTEELAARNFGMASPQGARKAARLMRLAAKLGIPVVTLVDTPGAYPGIDAEQDGQAFAIAENLKLMSALPVPIVSVITGEGGSGGALSLSVADRVYAFAHATYSVISPEGCAAILWKSASAAPQAARALRVDAPELLRLGVVDGVVPEPDGGAQADPAQAAENLRAAVSHALAELLPLEKAELVRLRRRRFRRHGTGSLQPAPSPSTSL